MANDSRNVLHIGKGVLECNASGKEVGSMSTHLLTQGKKAWEQYLEKDVLDSRLVRGTVASSWQRCRGLNVNPLLTSGDEAEQLRHLEQRRYEKEQLIRVARPFLHDLSYF